MTTFEQFSDVFRENLVKRSRTARGLSETGVSSKKKKLLLEGEELVRQVAQNIERLVRAVWDSSHFLYFSRKLPLSTELRAFAESWFDIINNKLQAEDAYREEFEKLVAEAEFLASKVRIPIRINARYRLWEVPYSSRRIGPLVLEFAMDDFYWDLWEMIGKAQKGTVSQAELLAFADYTIDQDIHPWVDSCGRSATAMVMWLSVILPESAHPRLPVFGSREEHYARMSEGLESFTKYYKKCLGLA